MLFLVILAVDVEVDVLALSLFVSAVFHLFFFSPAPLLGQARSTGET